LVRPILPINGDTVNQSGYADLLFSGSASKCQRGLVRRDKTSVKTAAFHLPRLSRDWKESEPDKPLAMLRGSNGK
jgi:hypothetical protein